MTLGYSPDSVTGRTEKRKAVQKDKAARYAKQSRNNVLEKLETIIVAAERSGDDSTILRALDQQAKILHLYSEKAFALDVTRPIFIVINTRRYREMEEDHAETIPEDETFPAELPDKGETGDTGDDTPGHAPELPEQSGPPGNEA